MRRPPRPPSRNGDFGRPPPQGSISPSIYANPASSRPTANAASTGAGTSPSPPGRGNYPLSKRVGAYPPRPAKPPGGPRGLTEAIPCTKMRARFENPLSGQVAPYANPSRNGTSPVRTRRPSRGIGAAPESARLRTGVRLSERARHAAVPRQRIADECLYAAPRESAPDHGRADRATRLILPIAEGNSAPRRSSLRT